MQSWQLPNLKFNQERDQEISHIEWSKKSENTRKSPKNDVSYKPGKFTRCLQTPCNVKVTFSFLFVSFLYVREQLSFTPKLGQLVFNFCIWNQLSKINMYNFEGHPVFNDYVTINILTSEVVSVVISTGTMFKSTDTMFSLFSHTVPHFNIHNLLPL